MINEDWIIIIIPEAPWVIHPFRLAWVFRPCWSTYVANLSRGQNHQFQREFAQVFSFQNNAKLHHESVQTNAGPDWLNMWRKLAVNAYRLTNITLHVTYMMVIALQQLKRVNKYLVKIDGRRWPLCALHALSTFQECLNDGNPIETWIR